MTRLPISLERPPLVEAIVEIRFSSTQNVGDVLPGLLFASFRREFPRGTPKTGH